MYWMLTQKAQNANQGTDHKKMLSQKGRAAVDKAMHLLAMQLILKKGLMAHMMANAAAERRMQAAMQFDMQTKILQKIGSIPTSQQTQVGESKEEVDKEGGKPVGTCAGFSVEDWSTMENGIPKLTNAVQIQKMQDKADVICKLQRELQKDVQAYKLSRFQDDDASSDVSSTGTKNETPHTLAVPDQAVQKHNRGTKRQVKDAVSWERVPPGPNVPHTMMTKSGKCGHWCPHHNQWTQHIPDKCGIQPVIES